MLVYGDIYFVALLASSWNWGESKSSQICLVINGTDWYKKMEQKVSVLELVRQMVKEEEEGENAIFGTSRVRM